MGKTTTVVVLGGLSIDRGGGSSGSATLPGRRAELVFAYLVAEHRRSVSRDELADALWPERLPDTWAPAVRGVMSDVRRFLESSGLDADDVLITERSGYRLRLPDDVVVDLDEARAELVDARERLSAGDATLAAAKARRAADLTALPFLPEHEGPWVDGIREELATLHANALEVQVHALAEAGDARAAADVAELLVRAEPFSEPAHQLRISVLADAHDRAGAIKAYEHCKTVLAAELGVEPSPDTDAVLQRALGRAQAEDTVPAAPAAAPADPGGPFARMSVLVVEDHAFQRRTAIALLRGLGVGTVADAPDGNAALELLEGSAPPDVIVCDIDMPGMDGAEFIRRVAQRGLASAIAIASALDRRLLGAIQSVSEGYGLQVLGAAEKPLTARRLRELLEAYRPPPRRDERGDGVAISAHALTEALRDDRIVADLQPIVDLASGRVSAAQLVVGWREAGTPPIGQDAFEHLLEGDLATVFVDRIVGMLGTHLRELDCAGLPIDLWVSMPDAGLADVTLADRLIDRVHAGSLDPRRIACVLSARALHRDVALHVLTRLRVMGFGLCLDDFGSTRMSAHQLERIPVTAVRVAEHVICGAHADPARVAILQEAVDIARGLDLSVIGGGCETDVDFELLLEVGCDFGQGAVIAGPMQTSELPGWARSWTSPLVEDQP